MGDDSEVSATTSGSTSCGMEASSASPTRGMRRDERRKEIAEAKSTRSGAPTARNVIPTTSAMSPTVPASTIGSAPSIFRTAASLRPQGR
ncbi:MAG: hypothetical protein ACRDOS_01405 [Gaiellaceae bacterium]